jgi:hypothetical protein
VAPEGLASAIMKNIAGILARIQQDLASVRSLLSPRVKHRQVLERNPDRAPKRPGQMGHRSVPGHDQIEIYHQGGGVDKGVRLRIEIGSQQFDSHSGGRSANCATTASF